MGRISRALSEVGVSVLTVELEGRTASDALVTWRSMRRPGVRGGIAGLEVVGLSFVVVRRCTGPWGCRGVWWVSFRVIGGCGQRAGDATSQHF